MIPLEEDFPRTKLWRNNCPETTEGAHHSAHSTLPYFLALQQKEIDKVLKNSCAISVAKCSAKNEESHFVGPTPTLRCKNILQVYKQHSDLCSLFQWVLCWWSASSRALLFQEWPGRSSFPRQARCPFHSIRQLEKPHKYGWHSSELHRTLQLFFPFEDKQHYCPPYQSGGGTIPIPTEDDLTVASDFQLAKTGGKKK